MKKIIGVLVFLSLIAVISAQGDTATYCLEHYTYRSTPISYCGEKFARERADGQALSGYTCEAEPFPEELKQPACQGGVGVFISKIGYECEDTNIECISGYEYQPNNYPDCKLADTEEAIAYPFRSGAACGNSGAGLAYAEHEIYPNYCCAYYPEIELIQEASPEIVEAQRIEQEEATAPPPQPPATSKSQLSVYVVGEQGLISRYNESSSEWKVMKQVTNNSLNSIWGTNSNTVYAVGDRGTILQYIKGGWVNLDGTRLYMSLTERNLNSVWGTDQDNVYAVGDNGTIIHFNGNTWTIMERVTQASLYSVYGNSRDNIYAVGQWGTILHYDGNKWTIDHIDGHGIPGFSILNSVWVSPSGKVYISGKWGDDLRLDFTNGALVRLWRDRKDVYLFHYPLSQILGLSDDEIYLMSRFSLLKMIPHNNTAPNAWYRTFSRQEITRPSIWGTSSNNIYLITGEREIIHLKEGWNNDFITSTFQYSPHDIWGGTEITTMLQAEPSIGEISVLTRVLNFFKKIFLKTDTKEKSDTWEFVEVVEQKERNELPEEQATGVSEKKQSLTEEETEEQGAGTVSELEIVKEFNVYAKENALSSSGTALDTGIDLKEGDVLEIQATGEWNIGYEIHQDILLGECDADGFSKYTVSPGTGVAYPFGTLVGSLGDGTQWFLIGTNLKKTMTLHGRLYLLCWDDLPDDNNGYLTVEVKVNSKE